MTGNLRPLERVRNISQQDFANVILSDRPIIIEDATRGWYACGGWTPDYLAQKLGQQRIRIRTSATHIHPDSFELPRRPLWSRVLSRLGARAAGPDRIDDAWISVGDYLKLLATSAQAFRYMTGSQELSVFHDGRWNESFAALRPDYAVPAHVPQSRLHDCGLWISPKGCRSHLHYDGECVHNLNAQVMGSKHVQLYSPALTGKLYPYLYTTGHLANFSQVDVEDVDHRRFPLFSEVDGYEGTLEAGDLLLIPAFWYHTFKHIGDFNVNVNFWWRAEFVRLTPVSAREYYGSLVMKAGSGSRIRQWWLYRSLRKMERDIVQSR